MFRSLTSGALLLVTALCIAGCGLFTPLTPESPESPLVSDPLHFNAIMDGTNAVLSTGSYRDMFTSGCSYVDGITSFSYSKITGRIETITAKYRSGDSLNISVSWTKKDPLATETFDTRTEAVLQPRLWSIRSGDSILYSGESTFRMQYDKELSAWRISYWKDHAVDGFSLSFFNPDYGN